MSSTFLAKLAVALLKSAKDEKALGKVVLIVLSPFLGLIFFVILIVQVATSPELWHEGEDYSYLMEQMENTYVPGESGGSDIQVAFLGMLEMPCEKSRISSDYGMRLHPIDKVMRKHTGVDFATSHHSNITSVAGGEVVTVKTDNIFGRNITIKHVIGEQIIYSFYAHLSKIEVEVNELVTAGQVVGIEGGQPGVDTNNGKSTGHHLHFEIRTKPNYASNVDPKKYLKGF